MKTLYITRHAKSSWKHADLSDFQRPLNKRGLRAIPLIGQWLNQHQIKPQYIISSPATRAITTAQMLAQQLTYPLEFIVENNDLYVFTFDVALLLPIIQNCPDTYTSLMLVGHNPTLTALANSFIGDYFDNIPTCGIVAIKIYCDTWAEVAQAKAVLWFHIFPKMLI